MRPRVVESCNSPSPGRICVPRDTYPATPAKRNEPSPNNRVEIRKTPVQKPLLQPTNHAFGCRMPLRSPNPTRRQFHDPSTRYSARKKIEKTPSRRRLQEGALGRETSYMKSKAKPWVFENSKLPEHRDRNPSKEIRGSMSPHLANPPPCPNGAGCHSPLRKRTRLII